MRLFPEFNGRFFAALVVVAFAVAACGGDGEPTSATSTSSSTSNPPTDTPDPEDVDDVPPASISVDCTAGSTLDDLPYDRARLGHFGDVATETRWLQRTFTIDNPTDAAVAFETGPTVAYLDADGATVAELVADDRTGPAFAAASGQTAQRSSTALDGINAAFLLSEDPATVDDVLDRATSCVLVDPPDAMPLPPTSIPAGLEITTQGPCSLDDDGSLLEQGLQIVNRGPAPVAIHPLVEVTDASGDRLGLLSSWGPTVIDAGATIEVTTAAAAFTVVDRPIDACTILSTNAISPSLELVTHTEVVVDPSRPTEERRDGDGNVRLEARDDRQIPVTFLRRDDGEAQPLIVWLHGLGGFADTQDPLMRHLAAAGYTVALVNQPETSGEVLAVAGFALLPGDVGAVLDAIVEPADGFGDELAPSIDLDRVAVAGHSIGGAGVLAMTSHTCCTDARVDAGVVFGASFTAPFEGEYRFSQAPLLLIHGTADEIADHAAAEATVAAANGNVSLLSLDAADHFTPVYGSERAEARLARDAMIAFLDVHVAGTAEASALDEFDLNR